MLVENDLRRRSGKDIEWWLSYAKRVCSTLNVRLNTWDYQCYFPRVFVRCPICVCPSFASQISHRISVRQLPKSSSNFSQVLKFRVGPPVPQSNDDQVHDAWCWTARCCSGEYLCHDASGTLAQWSSSPTSISEILMHIREQRSRVDRGIQSRWIILSWSNFVRCDLHTTYKVVVKLLDMDTHTWPLSSRSSLHGLHRGLRKLSEGVTDYSSLTTRMVCNLVFSIFL